MSFYQATCKPCKENQRWQHGLNLAAFLRAFPWVTCASDWICKGFGLKHMQYLRIFSASPQKRMGSRQLKIIKILFRDASPSSCNIWLTWNLVFWIYASLPWLLAICRRGILVDVQDQSSCPDESYPNGLRKRNSERFYACNILQSPTSRHI